jgi:hypothetical protein
MADAPKPSGNSTHGGIHFPDVSQIFRHHPTRPPPPGSAAHTTVPMASPLGYAKYFAAGALCATITHVPSIHI